MFDPMVALRRCTTEILAALIASAPDRAPASVTVHRVGGKAQADVPVAGVASGPALGSSR